MRPDVKHTRQDPAADVPQVDIRARASSATTRTRGEIGRPLASDWTVPQTVALAVIREFRCSFRNSACHECQGRGTERIVYRRTSVRENSSKGAR